MVKSLHYLTNNFSFDKQLFFGLTFILYLKYCRIAILIEILLVRIWVSFIFIFSCVNLDSTIWTKKINMRKRFTFYNESIMWRVFYEWFSFKEIRHKIEITEDIINIQQNKSIENYLIFTNDQIWYDSN